VLFNDTIGVNIRYGREGERQRVRERRVPDPRFHLDAAEGLRALVGGAAEASAAKAAGCPSPAHPQSPADPDLDEATSARGQPYEKEIQDGARAVAASAPARIATVSTVVHSDNIIVLDMARS